MLVGTVSIEKSERLSTLLKRRGIKHVVLNAKYHAQEAEIVAQAGRKGAVTIATNMAGRGTDILLGGNPEFMARQQSLAEEVAERLPKGEEKFVDDDEFVYFFHLDSFYRVPRADWERIFAHFKAADATPSTTRSSPSAACTSSAPSGTRRGASTTSCAAAPAARAIPGSSRFYLSLEDDLMRIFGSDRISGLMQRLGMEEGVPIEHGMVTTRHRARAEAGRGAELRRPQAPARVRRRDEQAAREHLHAAPRAARGQDPHRPRTRRSTRAAT